MRVSTLVYTIKQGLRNIVHNKMFSIASIATMAACIFMFGVFGALIFNLQKVAQTIEESVAIVVYFDVEATDKQVKKIGDKLEAREEVVEVKYVSGDEAWEKFQVDYFGEDSNLAAGFEDDNPLKDSDNYEVYMNDVSKQDDLVEYAKGLEGVRKVDASVQAADAISKLSMGVTTVAIGAIVFLLAIAIFLINNTVSMGITIRREEIAIMKYIGAKDAFVRAPFIFEGIIIGLVGASIPLGILYFVYTSIIKALQQELESVMAFRTVELLAVGDVYKVLLPVGLLLGVGIGFVGSFFTIRKHLKA